MNKQNKKYKLTQVKKQLLLNTQFVVDMINLPDNTTGFTTLHINNKVYYSGDWIIVQNPPKTYFGIIKYFSCKNIDIFVTITLLTNKCNTEDKFLLGVNNTFPVHLIHSKIQ